MSIRPGSRLPLLVVLLVVPLGAPGCDSGSSGPSAECSTNEDCASGFVCERGDWLRYPEGTCSPSESDTTAELSVPDATEDQGREVSLPDTNVEPDTSVGCADGITQCSSGGDVEICSAGSLVLHETCPYGCRDGACRVPSSGTCSDPVPLAIGDNELGTTDTLYNPNSWSQTCGNAYGDVPIGPETVFVIDVPSPQYLRLSLRALDLTHFGIYVRGTCDDRGTELHSMCDGNSTPGGSIELEGLFAAGEHYVFVDDFGLSSVPPGVFELTVEPALMPSCGDQLPQVLDLSAGSMTFEGDTEDGYRGEIALEYHCPNDAFQTVGSELAYAFALRNPSDLIITASALDPTDTWLEIYLRSDCEDRFSQVGCGSSDGTMNATIDTTLDAGAYVLYIDDFADSVDGPQVFELSIEVQ